MTDFNRPYTYLIGWTAQHKFYYGVRYAKKCNPADLWNKYFTSSKEVAAMRILYGEPDVIQIRKIFRTKEHARIWESKVIRRLNVVSREDFLNKNDVPAPPINNQVMSDSTKISIVHKGKPKSEEHKQKIREARAKQVNTRKGSRASEETKQKIREARAKQIITAETRDKMSVSRKGEKHWTYGKPRSEETKQKISNTLRNKSIKKGNV